MPSREYAMFVVESSYGVAKSTPVKGTDLFYFRLHDSDAFTGQMTPVLLDIPYGGGRATPALQVSDQYATPFSLRTYLYAGAQSATLLNWCMTPVNSGRTAPWTTTDANYVMPVGDLASISIYHAFQKNDGTYDLRRYGGCKVDRWTITCSRQSPIALLTVQGNAMRDNLKGDGTTVGYPDGTEFPAPAETDYPTGPYLFSHTGGFLQLNTGSTARTLYSSITISGNNVLDPRYFESQYMQLARFCGRTTSLEAQLYLQGTALDLANLQNKTKINTSIEFSNGTNNFKIDMLTNNYLKSAARNFPINQVFQYTVRAQNFWDASGASDLTLTTA